VTAVSVEARKPLERAREFFTLRDASARAAKLTPEDHARAEDDFAAARQKNDAAQALWIHGSTAEGYRLAIEASELLIRVATIVGVPEATLTELRALSASPGPRLDSAMTAEHAVTFDKLIEAQSAVLRSAAPVAMNERGRLRTRINRIAWTVIATLAVLFVVRYLVRPPLTLRGEASASYNANYLPTKAVDGSNSTEWLLPDRTAGHLDVAIAPQRRVRHVRILNSHNPPHNDRATREYRIEVYAKGSATPAKSIDGAFGEFSSDPKPVSHDIGVDKVERIRIVVKSWHKDGAGIAEVEVD